MACTIKVLTTVRNFTKDDFKNKDGRFNAIKNIQEELEEQLKDLYPNAITYFNIATENSPTSIGGGMNRSTAATFMLEFAFQQESTII